MLSVSSKTQHSYHILLKPAHSLNATHKSIYQIKKLLRATNLDAGITELKELKEAAGKAHQFSKSFNHVIAAGGDGTISAIAAGLMNTDCTLGILPMGSGNDLARGLQIPRTLSSALQLIKTGKPRKMDLGIYNASLKSGVFMNTLGVGFDGKVSYIASHTKFFRGRFKYFYGVLKSIMTYQASEISVELDDETITDKLLMVTLANSSVEGGGIRIAPDATPFDGFFDVVIIKDTGLISRIFLLIRVLLRGAKNEKRILIKRSKKVRVQSKLPQFAHADGELISKNLTFISGTIKPGVINIITGLQE